ncbi:hypothetical protein ACFO4O_02340 [Glaciecola siphonariae]|uniref:Uncharacterized protein n=1 Tax=Glaciecola siphonariae TaxID=521012 RepID=A0ABV9LRC5_9ALTE
MSHKCPTKTPFTTHYGPIGVAQNKVGDILCREEFAKCLKNKLVDATAVRHGVIEPVSPCMSDDV